jgi:hypothetical protein
MLLEMGWVAPRQSCVALGAQFAESLSTEGDIFPSRWRLKLVPEVA